MFSTRYQFIRWLFLSLILNYWLNCKYIWSFFPHIFNVPHIYLLHSLSTTSSCSSNDIIVLINNQLNLCCCLSHEIHSWCVDQAPQTTTCKWQLTHDGVTTRWAPTCRWWQGQRASRSDYRSSSCHNTDCKRQRHSVSVSTVRYQTLSIR